MSGSFIKFGTPLKKQCRSALTIVAARKTFEAIEAHPDFKLDQLSYTDDADRFSEILIVECVNDGVFSKNAVGIRYCERLGLRFFENSNIPPEVRALRADFPQMKTPHQNHVSPDEPASLCLYLEEWSSVIRSWTPQKHLSQIQRWLVDTANERLHADDQPLEPIYFRSIYDLVLPSDFDAKAEDPNYALVVERRLLTSKNFRVLIGQFTPIADAANQSEAILSCLTLSLPPVVHGRVEPIPASLGELDDQLAARGTPLAELLFNAIQHRAAGNGLNPTKENHTLLILKIPIIRHLEATPENYQIKGFLIRDSVGQLGIKGDVLTKHEGRYWLTPLLSGGERQRNVEWRDIPIEPIEVLPCFTRALARKTAGIESSGPNGLLAGVGALGSAMFNIWIREGWGTWSLIDDDILKPHNLARHTAFEFQVGTYKVDAVSNLEEHIYPEAKPERTALPEKANNFENVEVCRVLDSANIIIDVTTTLEVPRDLSSRRNIKRAASVFLTPSGLDSVLLMEDSDRAVRLDVLEAQYYRAIISNSWGDTHLTGHSGRLWAGAGCRAASAIISNELVQLHAATLARQVRLRAEQPIANILVWKSNPETGEVLSNIAEPSCPIFQELDGLTIVWDEALRDKACSIRARHLPNETGGVLVGYFDLKLSRVYVVDILQAPSDSEGDKSGFTRGITGLAQAIQTAQNKTAGIVSYIGEWHSHPPKVTAKPSSADLHLLGHLARELHNDGLPAIMLIVGENEERWLVGEYETANNG